jgi:hypothetical protein
VNRYRYQVEFLFLAPEEIGGVAFKPVFLPSMPIPFVDWHRCLSFLVCSIRIERKVSSDLIYEIFSNMSFTSTRQDKEKCSKSTSKVRSWKTRLEAM